ncbi:glycosyltransferase family 2 protein [Galbibacter sp. BG1]|uniref:glycosyltransferase family 2 protein n=1 Tax=Galbibacter sp. BG1 TaxID=1170699 RepID=UPI0015BADDA4|nr:glycosyltransferase family 2 protein [Galbibacter sp. BG1]QLE02798.1 glycosyltransferase family 2 protein [Galbibacter sp. BG1]
MTPKETKMNSFVSIIMPVYNVEDYIEKAIESVINQTYKNFELLIIDDGSPDESIAKAITFQQKDPRIEIFHKKNGGLSDARNYGLEKSKGEFIYFLDSDDWIEPDLLEKCIKSVANPQNDVVVFGYHLDTVDNDDKLIHNEKMYSNSITITQENAKDVKIDDTLLNLIGYAWNKLYRASLLKDHDLFFEKGTSLIEDILFNTQVYKKAVQIQFIPNALYHYINRQRETLIKTFHKDAYQLILKKHYSLKSLLDHWGFEGRKRNRILAQSIVLGIKYAISNLLSYNNNLSAKEKRDYINYIYQHKETKKYIDFYTPKTKSDIIYKKLIKYRLVALTIYLKSWKKAA